MTRDDETRLVYSTGSGPVDVRKDGQQKKKGGPPPSTSRTPGGVGIRIRLDRRASDRVVTVVTGLPGSAADVAALAKALKSVCGAGGTVKDGALELQGDHRDTVEARLSAAGLKSKRSGG